jgi:hypothetical protein
MELTATASARRSCTARPGETDGFVLVAPQLKPDGHSYRRNAVHHYRIVSSKLASFQELTRRSSDANAARDGRARRMPRPHATFRART